MGGEIIVVTGNGHGHLHPCMELCNYLASRNFQTTLVVSSSLTSSIPASFPHKIAPITPSGFFMPGSAPNPTQNQAAHDLETLLTKFNQSPPICAVIDFQTAWTKSIFQKFNVPVISLFTFGATAAAMEWAAWKIQAIDTKPGETRLIPGLPDEMGLTYTDLKRKPPSGPGKRGPPKPGDCPPWVPAIEGSIALIFNTCEDLERPFLSYIADQIGIPAFGIGPLLSEKYWNNSLISDRLIRDDRNRQSNVTEDDVIQWLNNKPRGSVLYVAFGSEVSPTIEEYSELAAALTESKRPFIWALQSGSVLNELETKAGDRGLVIYGWAPQLLILSHESTGGFLSHCGWNSTVEAIGRGVRVLAWPIRGDQHFNAKLVVSWLKVGYKVAEDLSEMVRKEDVVKGIEKVMGDDEMRERAGKLRESFGRGFPAEAALDAFRDFIVNQKKEAP